MDKSPKDKNQSKQKPPKTRKYFNTPTIKVYNPISVHVITRYRLGQSTFCSCDHVSGQTRAQMDKSIAGQKPQRIKIKEDKSNKTENNLLLQQLNCTIPFLFMRSRGTGVHNPNSVHMIKWWDREKPNGQKHNRTKAPRIKIKADKSPTNPENILILPTIKVYNPISIHVIT